MSLGLLASALVVGTFLLLLGKRSRRARQLAEQKRREAEAWEATDNDAADAGSKCAEALEGAEAIYADTTPDRAIAHYCFAVHHHRNNRLKAALDHYVSAVEWSQNANASWCAYRAGLYSDRAWCHAERDEFHSASEWIDRAAAETRSVDKAERDEVRREVLMAKAFVALRMKQTGEAEAILREIVGEANSGAAYRSDAFRSRASSVKQASLGRYTDDDAYRMLERVFEPSPISQSSNRRAR